MGEYRTISAVAEGAVTTLTIRRPDRANAVTPTVFAELADAIDKAVEAGARALVLTAEGKFFCSGTDIQGDGADTLPDDLGAILGESYNPFGRKLAALEIPLVTAINGPAAGMGVGLALAGDVVVMAQSAYLLLAFVNIGLAPDFGSTWLVARSAGRARALEMAMLGERMPAAEAKAAGLVTRLVPDEDVLSTAQALAARLAAGPTRALGLIRRQVNFALDHDFSALLDLERDNQRKLGFTQDFAEAIAAFGEKRKPQFKGQ